MERLIVTCDDCGLSEGVNRAALDLCRRGMAGSASVLANFPASAHALALLRAVPALDMGVHLNLTDGYPLTAIPAAAGLTGADGRFRPMGNLVRQMLFPSPRALAAIEAELDAQCAMLARAGIPIGHLTTHLQFHLLPRLRPIVARLAKAHGAAWVRTHRLRATLVPGNPLASRALRLRPPVRPGTSATLADGAGGPSTAFPEAAPDYLAVLRNWQGRPPAALARALAELSGTVELVVHPGVADDPGFPSYVGYGAAGRFAETQFFERCWPLLR